MNQEQFLAHLNLIGEYIPRFLPGECLDRWLWMTAPRVGYVAIWHSRELRWEYRPGV